MGSADKEHEGTVDQVTNEQLYAELRRIGTRVDRLDETIRGSNGEGLVTRVAVLRTHTDGHGQSINRAHDRVGDLEKIVARIDRRIVFFSGGAAAIGALVASLAQSVISRLVG